MIDFEHEYIVIFVKCEITSQRFFIDTLGFSKYENIEIAGKNCPILQMQTGDYVMLIEKEVIEPDMITLMTDDCLRDYHLIRTQEVVQLGKPQYTAAGLSVSFLDPSGNQITILEARDYSDA